MAAPRRSEPRSLLAMYESGKVLAFLDLGFLICTVTVISFRRLSEVNKKHLKTQSTVPNP